MSEHFHGCSDSERTQQSFGGPSVKCALHVESVTRQHARAHAAEAAAPALVVTSDLAVPCVEALCARLAVTALLNAAKLGVHPHRIKQQERSSAFARFPRKFLPFSCFGEDVECVRVLESLPGE